MIDTHAHVTALDDPDEVVYRAAEAGVTRVLTVGTSVDDCRRALSLAERQDGVFAILGIHPHEAEAASADDLAELRELLTHPKAVAVGETGLDWFRDYAPRDDQLRLFEAELELAAELGKPVVIHTRAADDDTLAALADHAGTVVLHCFSAPRMLKSSQNTAPSKRNPFRNSSCIQRLERLAGSASTCSYTTWAIITEGRSRFTSFW